MFQTQSSLIGRSISLGNRFIIFRNAYRIHYTVISFCLSIGSYFSQLIISYMSASPTFHLCIKYIGTHITHKEHDLQRLYIRSRSNKRYRYGNSEIFFYPKISYQNIGIAGSVGDFANKILGNFSAWKFLAKYLFHDFYDLCGVIIVFCEYERFGNILPITVTFRIGSFGIQFCVNRISVLG